MKKNHQISWWPEPAHIPQNAGLRSLAVMISDVPSTAVRPPLGPPLTHAKSTRAPSKRGLVEGAGLLKTLAVTI